MAQREEPSGTHPTSGARLPTVRTTFSDDLASMCGLESRLSVHLPGATGSEPRPARVEGLDPTAQHLRYVYLGDVGQGGMGAVYRVFDQNLRRTLAMKVILGPDPSKRAPRVDRLRELSSRFLEEAQITGQLEHPGVVPVYDLGLDDDKQLYFTMRLVRGRNLEEVLALVATGAEGWSRTRALGVLLKVCETMSFAHDKGVIHRDLKPANVMVGRYGEVYVVDWGLAKVEGREDSHDLRPQRGSSTSLHTERSELREQRADSPLITMDGTIVGTPYYMAREQAIGRSELVGARSDVYAVGALLYHLLTGRMPYHTPGDHVSPQTVLAMVIHGPPRAVHELAPDVPAELAAICERAMARELDERYASMTALADDLRAYLEGRVVGAYETGAVAELRKWVRRNKPLAASIAGGILAVLAGISGVGIVQAHGKSELKQVNDVLLATNTRLDAERATSERAFDFLNDMLSQQDPTNSRGATVTVKEVLDREAARIRGQLEQDPEVRLRLMGTMGQVYHALGLFEQSRPLLVDALAGSRTTLGEASPATWSALDRLGSLLLDTGEHEDARGLLQEALARREQALGPEHPDSLLSLYRMATLSYHLGDLPHAEELFRRTLEAQTRVLGAGDPATLETRQNLTALHVTLGRSREAAEEYRELVRAMTESLGEDEPRTLFATSNLAFVLLDLAQLDEAERLCLWVLERRERVLDREHPDRLTSLHNLALVHARQGRISEAAAEFSEAYELRVERLGERSQDTLLSLSSLVLALELLGEQERVLELGGRYLALARQELPVADPELLAVLQILHDRHAALGRRAEADALGRELTERRAAAGVH